MNHCPQSYTPLARLLAWTALSLVGFSLSGCGEDTALSSSASDAGASNRPEEGPDSKPGDSPDADAPNEPNEPDTPDESDAGVVAPGLPNEEVAQNPPQGESAIEAWLAEAHYEDWRCEEDISPPRAGGVHGYTRVCWNDALVNTAATPYPVGASLVKALFNEDEEPQGFAVNVKVEAGTGDDTWYFYERIGSGAAVADGVGVAVCAGCHSGSPNDYVFVRPR